MRLTARIVGFGLSAMALSAMDRAGGIDCLTQAHADAAQMSHMNEIPF